MIKNQYFPAIDGLRAICVLAVIIHHYFSDIGAAGYLGVDAFFVISGFVISHSVSAYPYAGSLQEFSARFYLRRIKRLFPVLLLMVFVVSICLVVFTSNVDIPIRTGALALVGISNFYLFYESTHYFSLASELNAFTHVWSLAVEDQFYILFPVLVWFFSNRKNSVFDADRLLRPLIVITLVSLAAFILLHKINYSLAFYMMPTRIWQVGLGVIVYILVVRGMYQRASKKIPLTLPLIGMFAVFAWGNQTPLIGHIFITLLTAMTLAIIGFRSVQFSVLNLGIMIYLGKISYSLYLWHWPILVLAKHTVGINSTTVLICIGLTLTLAIASYHFVERRFRWAKIPNQGHQIVTDFRKLFSFSLIACVLFIVFFEKLGSNNNNLLAATYQIPSPPVEVPHHCANRVLLNRYADPLLECLGSTAGSSNERDFYLLGDSHAHHLIPMITDEISVSGHRLKFANFEDDGYGIRGLINLENGMPPDIQYILNEAGSGDVFFLSFHRGRLNHRRDRHLDLRQEVTHNELSKRLLKNLHIVVRELTHKDVSVVLMLDTPLMASVTPSQTCVFQKQFSGKSVCEISKRQDKHTRWRQEAVFREIAVSIPGIEVWDPAPMLFTNNDTFDVVDENGKYMMSDWNHVTESALQRLKPEFRLILQRNQDSD